MAADGASETCPGDSRPHQTVEVRGRAACPRPLGPDRRAAGVIVRARSVWRDWRGKRRSATTEPPGPGRARDALDAGQQLDLASPTATTIVAHALDDIAKQHFTPVKVGLDEEPSFPHRSHLIAQHPGRERGERLVHHLGAGRQRVIPIAAPVAFGYLRPAIARRLSDDFLEQLDSGITAKLVLLGVEVLHRAEARRGLA